MKRILNILTLLAVGSLLLNSCAKPDEWEYRTDNTFSTIYLGPTNSVSDATMGTITQDTGEVYFNIPTSRQGDVDLSNVLVWIQDLPRDASVSPKLTGRHNMTSPKTITITAGNGDKKVYTLTARFQD